MSNGHERPISSVPWSGRRPLRTISRIVSSGACSVASTVKSAASAASLIVQRDAEEDYKVHWASFEKLEINGNVLCRVLLLGHSSGFQVWDVNDADNVRKVASKSDGPVFFLQLQPKPLPSNALEDKFVDSRPLLVLCSSDLHPASTEVHDLRSNCHSINKFNSRPIGYPLSSHGGFVPSTVLFYSLKSLSYVHVLKFRSAIYSVRCSSRICAVAQSSQIHCFEAATLERKYTILTNPITYGAGSSSTGYGPLAVGCRWLAYSGSPVVLNTGCVVPQHFTPPNGSPGSASSGSLVAYYARESSKQLAAGIATLGDIGYKKFSRYCSEFLPDHYRSQPESVESKSTAVIGNQFADTDSVGMVIVRDVLSKAVIVQFRAHKSPISALCFDPSGVLLVTASIQGHNINVFRITPNAAGSCTSTDVDASYTHLYQLQRGFTNAVIQDISFSSNSHWIMVSSSRGTSHLFSICQSGESSLLQPYETSANSKTRRLNSTRRCSSLSPLQSLAQQHGFSTSPPATLMAVARIRSGCSGRVVPGSDALVAAASRLSSPSGMTSTCFQSCEVGGSFSSYFSQRTRSLLLVFSPSGCIVQYELKLLDGPEVAATTLGFSEADTKSGWKLVIEPIKKWNIWMKHCRREREDDADIYGENDPMESFGILGHFQAPTHVKDNAVSEEKQHLYISEAEIQIQHTQSPLWTKPEIYFQSMIIDNTGMVEDNIFGGEVDIERIPTRIIEARLKDLVPVFEVFQKSRLIHHKSDMVGPGGVACGNLTASLDHMINSNPENSQTVSTCGTPFSYFSDLQNGMKQTKMTTVNKRTGSEMYSQLGVVNSTDGFNGDGQFKVVNNGKGTCGGESG